MAITIVARGTDTLPVSYNELSTVTVAEAATTAGDTVLITATSALPSDLKFDHSMYVSEVTGDGFTVSSSYNNISTAITFAYIVCNDT